MKIEFDTKTLTPYEASIIFCTLAKIIDFEGELENVKFHVSGSYESCDKTRCVILATRAWVVKEGHNV